MKEVKLDKIPYGLTEEQAIDVFEYVRLRFRMQDVLNTIEQDEDNGWFYFLTEKHQEEMLEEIAQWANDAIGEGARWYEAVEDGIEKAGKKND